MHDEMRKLFNSRYPNYAISPRDDVCHGNPRMRSEDSTLIESTIVCFFPLKIFTCVTKITEFQYKLHPFEKIPS